MSWISHFPHNLQLRQAALLDARVIGLQLLTLRRDSARDHFFF
jgi:hypothetical protein